MRTKRRDVIYNRQVEEYLYTITYRFLNQPAPGNRWYYPDVFLWDEDGNGEHTIPALIAFYFNQSFRYPADKRTAFKFQLAAHVPGPWDCYWMMGEGIVWAERRVEGIEPRIPLPVRELSRVGMASEDENFARNGHKNGHKEGLDATNLMEFPDLEV